MMKTPTTRKARNTVSKRKPKKKPGRKPKVKSVDGTLPSDDAEKLVKHWLKCPPSGLSNMFFTYDTNSNQRAVTYELPASALQDLLEIYNKKIAEGKECHLKVYMGCKSNYRQEGIMEGSPGFTPFVQLDVVGEKTTVPFPNCYLPFWRQRSTIPLTNKVYRSSSIGATKSKGIVHLNFPRPNNVSENNNDSRISPKTAHIFLEEWCMVNNMDIENLFTGIVEGLVARVNSFTFIKEDLIKIAALYEEDPTRNLYIHLAVIKPQILSPFGFHIVLEMATFTSGNIKILDDGGSTFFEFGYPCPPYCIGPGG